MRIGCLTVGNAKNTERFLDSAGLALVAVHAWDCHGAKRAGCLAGWCARLEGRYGDTFAPLDATGDDLTEVVERLLDLPAD